MGHLYVERVGRVNLIVGRNNAGKSTLLEAIRLWASQGSPSVFRDILVRHDEVRVGVPRALETHEDVFSGVLSLFHGREPRGPLDRQIQIEAPLSPDSRLVIEPAYRRANGDTYRLPFSTVEGVFADVTPGLAVAFADREQFFAAEVFTRAAARPATLTVREDDSIATVSVGPEGLSGEQIGRLWDAIALTDLEERVIEALRLITPEIERLSLVADEVGRRIAVVKVLGANVPVPLRSLGDGVNRLLGTALSLANARNGIALLDEVENGVHYSVQPKVWDLIFSTAQRLNIQVFATTHSWDCIDAFQQAAVRDPHEEAALIRLDAVGGGEVRATIFDERELSVVAREEIEVR